MIKRRNTEQKKIIYDQLTCADHPTASELYDALHDENPKISRATVFRVLLQFANHGEVMRIDLGDGEARYDFRTTPHAHFRCTSCGKIYDVMQEIPSITDQALEGFVVNSSELCYRGICRNCNKLGK
jgi:Fe2+ or Zn2+ uptake regulation protein